MILFHIKEAFLYFQKIYFSAEFIRNFKVNLSIWIFYKIQSIQF